MAAAEARAAWQRTANRYFVQEDAKRAPKLAYCPSSSSASKQVDSAPASATDGPEHPTLGFMPLKRNPSSSNLPPETRWWLQLQPNYGYQKGFTYEQVNALEAEVEIIRAGVVNSANKCSDVHFQNEDSPLVDGISKNESSINAHYKVSATCLKKKPEIIKQELKDIHGQKAQEFGLKDTKEFYESMEMDPIGCSVVKEPKELCFDSESPWLEAQKTEPWWRTADGDELASLVARKSLDQIDNCDLPRPQKTHASKDPFFQAGYFVDDGIFPSSLDRKLRMGLPKPTIQALGNLSSPSPYGRQCVSVEEGHLKCGSEKSPSYCTSHKEMTETQQITENDPSKAQLLEALRHSQTRAREAEKAAKQAYAEKEHIMKLFFRQASHLFAYKQWFQLLQLETMYIQFKNKDQPVSTLFPVVLPCTPHKARKPRKSLHKAPKAKRGKRGRPRYDISRYALAFALGLSLVGAGLLLGWTVGWMLPTL